MSTSDVERLGDSRYVVVLLRLLVDRDNRVVQGELGGLDDERWIRFRRADGLLPAVEAYVRRGAEPG